MFNIPLQILIIVFIDYNGDGNTAYEFVSTLDDGTMDSTKADTDVGIVLIWLATKAYVCLRPEEESLLLIFGAFLLRNSLV